MLNVELQILISVLFLLNVELDVIVNWKLYELSVMYMLNVESSAYVVCQLEFLPVFVWQKLWETRRRVDKNSNSYDNYQRRRVLTNGASK